MLLHVTPPHPAPCAALYGALYSACILRLSFSANARRAWYTH